MFADKILEIVRNELKSKKTFANVHPFDDALPTSGDTFLRVHGVNEKLEYHELQLKVMPTIGITVSKRTPTHDTQNIYKPYLELIHLAESAFTAILTSHTILGEIRNILPPPLSMYGTFTANYLNLEPQKMFPQDYSSVENGERGHVGMKLQQDFLCPVIEIPIQCGVLPESLNNYFFQE